MDVTILECVHNLVHHIMASSRRDLYSEEMLCGLVAYTSSPIRQCSTQREIQQGREIPCTQLYLPQTFGLRYWAQWESGGREKQRIVTTAKGQCGRLTPILLSFDWPFRLSAQVWNLQKGTPGWTRSWMLSKGLPLMREHCARKLKLPSLPLDNKPVNSLLLLVLVQRYISHSKFRLSIQTGVEDHLWHPNPCCILETSQWKGMSDFYRQDLNTSFLAINFSDSDSSCSMFFVFWIRD